MAPPPGTRHAACESWKSSPGTPAPGTPRGPDGRFVKRALPTEVPPPEASGGEETGDSEGPLEGLFEGLPHAPAEAAEEAPKGAPKAPKEKKKKEKKEKPTFGVCSRRFQSLRTD